MIIGIPYGSEGPAKVSNGARPCTAQATPFPTSLGAGLQCQLWDTRGLDEAAGTDDRGFMTKIMDKIRILISLQAHDLKETLQSRIKPGTPLILMWCIDATKIDVRVHWQQFHKVYVEYCERKAIPVVVITRGPPRAEWETRYADQLQSLNLGVDVPFGMVRRHRSSQEYSEDSKALKDLISEIINKNNLRK